MNCSLSICGGPMIHSARIDTVSPVSGNPVGGGFIVTLQGSGFMGSTLTVDGNIVAPLTMPNDGVMTFAMLPLGLGARTIQVVSVSGAVATASFTVTL